MENSNCRCFVQPVRAAVLADEASWRAVIPTIQEECSCRFQKGSKVYFLTLQTLTVTLKILPTYNSPKKWPFPNTQNMNVMTIQEPKARKIISWKVVGSDEIAFFSCNFHFISNKLSSKEFILWSVGKVTPFKHSCTTKNLSNSSPKKTHFWTGEIYLTNSYLVPPKHHW